MLPPPQAKTYYLCLYKISGFTNQSLSRGAGRYRCFIVSLVSVFGFGMSRALLKSHWLKGQDSSTSAQRIQILLHALPACLSFFISFHLLWFSFRIRKWRIRQHFVSSSFPSSYCTSLLTWFPSYIFPLTLRSCPLYLPFPLLSSPCHPFFHIRGLFLVFCQVLFGPTSVWIHLDSMLLPLSKIPLPRLFHLRNGSFLFPPWSASLSFGFQTLLGCNLSF